MSPFFLSNSKEEEIHFLALSVLFSFQNILAIEQFSPELEAPQFSIATLAFFFLEATGSISIAFPHNYALFGQAFKAFDIKNIASLGLP